MNGCAAHGEAATVSTVCLCADIAPMRAFIYVALRAGAPADEFNSARCDDDVSGPLLKMACEVAAFLEQFQGETEVVLVHSERWTEYHKAIMEALTEGVRMFLRRRRHLSFEQLLDEFKESQPCAVSGALQISLLYGRETGLYLDGNSKLKMDIKGLVFKKP